MEELKRCPVCQGVGKHDMINGAVTLFRCETCDFVYASATDEEILHANSHNDQEMETRYKRIQSGYDIAWFDWTSKKLAAGKPTGRVLDIGCGNCLLLRSFKKLGWSCYGVDPSPWANKCAQDFNVTLFSASDSSVPQGRFDAVVCTSTLEHVAQPREHLLFAMRCLKEGGVGWWTVPNCSSGTLRLGLADLPPQTTPMHCNFFTAKTLTRLFSANDVRKKLDYVKVRSYGLPELYRQWKRLKLRRSPAQNVKRKNPSRSFMPGLLAQVYYWAGRPLNWGDKLEVRVRKAMR